MGFNLTPFVFPTTSSLDSDVADLVPTSSTWSYMGGRLNSFCIPPSGSSFSSVYNSLSTEEHAKALVPRLMRISVPVEPPSVQSKGSQIDGPGYGPNLR